jgi:hypothetical protein
MCGMWSLWNSRNDRRHGKNAINPKLTIDLAVDVCFQLFLDGLQCYEQALDRNLSARKLHRVAS